MDSFLAIAEELQLKGLKGSNDQNELNETELGKESLPIKPKQKYETKQMVSDTRTATKESKRTVSKEQRDNFKKEEKNALALPLCEDLGQLEENVKSMMETSANLVQMGSRQVRGKICKLCTRVEKRVLAATLRNTLRQTIWRV